MCAAPPSVTLDLGPDGEEAIVATASVNDVQLYYETAGAGIPLVLVHGSWGDARNWASVVGPLAEHFRVVSWDRRGHSRSRGGSAPGSRHEDAADLAALIEHVSDEPVHVVGNSYGASVALTLVASRPDLVASAAVHEPPLFALLEDTRDEHVANALAATRTAIAAVVELLEAGDHDGAARRFVDTVAFGPGAWVQLPERTRGVFVANAGTYLDECRDPDGLSIDSTALVATTVPLLLSHGTESPTLFPAVIRELSALVPDAHVAVLAGAGHVPHATHPDIWITGLRCYHEMIGVHASGPA
jgi:pimeloyl-ACP methyl ester carboxylesterase